jgi:phosphoribosylformylglycinamidine (FGAM) synthase-like enzyme
VNPAASEDALALPAPADLGRALLQLLASPSIANKRWIYRQYDSTVRTNTLVGPGSDAAVVRVKGTRKALAISTDGNGRYCWLDPFEGARLAVAEAARNVACSGATPIGATNCLNFGNPEKPEVMGQLVRAIQGMGEACRALDIPITGGNVSLYNETDGRAIYPTPVMGVVGLLEDADSVLRRWFVEEGDLVYLLGRTGEDLGGSELLKVVHGKIAGRPPRLDVEAEKRLHALLAEGAGRRILRSAHDASEGGLAVALAECCFRGEEPGPGGRFDLPAGLRPDVLLFSETPSRAVVTTRDELRLAELARRHGVPWARLGVVGGGRLTLASGGATLVDVPIDRLHEAWMSLEATLSESSLAGGRRNS